jgi:hypothetical protein
LTAEFFASPTWSILYTSFGQVSNLLSLPIWIVSFTLLYFDSRVRKEAYDLDLIAREINPGFYWQPTAQPAPFAYQSHPQSVSVRTPVQTSPLGLAGYRPPPPQTKAPSPESLSLSPEELPHTFRLDAENVNAQDTSESPLHSDGVVSASCTACGAPLLPGASFCLNCGSTPQ